MTFPVSPCLATSETCFISHIHQLSPRPYRKIDAVTCAHFLEFIRWLPIVLALVMAELKSPASTKKTPQRHQILKAMLKRMGEVSGYWESRSKPNPPFFATQKANTPSRDVVTVCEDLGNHSE